MNNEQVVKKSFVTALGLDEEAIVDSLEYNTIPEWDSIAHMRLIAELEEAFEIMIDTDDVLAMSTFAKAKEIGAKYAE